MSTVNENTDFLLYGNIGYFSKQDILSFFGQGHTAAAGPGCEGMSDGRIRWYRKDARDRTFPRLFRTYDFKTALYVSGYLTWQNEPDNEIEELRSFLHQCRKYGVERVVYLTSQDLCEDRKTSRRMELEFLESLCRYYADESFHLQIVRCPFFASGKAEGDTWRQIFASLESGKGWIFPVSPEEKLNFIAVEDLDEFLERLLDKPPEKNMESFDLRGYTEHTFEDAAELLRKKYPEQNISFSPDAAVPVKKFREDYARERFGWFARYDVFLDLDHMRAEYLEHPARQLTRRQKIRKRFTEGRGIRITELLLGAVLMEILNHVLDNSVQFRMIDVRLLYVVLLSSVYGMRLGFLAAILAIASLVGAYLAQGINGWMLFYAPENWLPFILLLLAAAVCGFVRERREDEKQDLESRLEETSQEKEYTEQLYEEAMDYKREYKQNLIQSRDSFGKIFGVVQKLSAMEPSKIYESAVSVMEDILENHSVAIYSVSESQDVFARLEVSSGELTGSLKRSIRLSDYPQIMEDVSREQVYVNREMKSSLPVYAMGISSEGKLRILLFLYHAGFEQMSAYYLNLFRVLGGLIKNSMLQAWSYQKAVEAGRYIGGTSLLTEEAFGKELSIRRDMADRNLISYCLFRIRGEDRSPQEIDRILAGKLRESDLVTYSRNENLFYVLALQADRNSEPLLLSRFRSLGLHCETVEIRGGEG